MTHAFSRRWRRYKKDERGVLNTIEFVILFPLMLTILLTAFEFGFYQIRMVFLDRGLDLAVRDVRLNTGTSYSHATLKESICDYAGFLDDCDSQLKLEMSPVDVRGFPGLLGPADCIDASEPVQPVRQFKHGVQHQLMVLRACYKFEPVFAGLGLGQAMRENGDASGMSRMIAASAFVQEP